METEEIPISEYKASYCYRGEKVNVEKFEKIVEGRISSPKKNTDCSEKPGINDKYEWIVHNKINKEIINASEVIQPPEMITETPEIQKIVVETQAPKKSTKKSVEKIRCSVSKRLFDPEKIRMVNENNATPSDSPREPSFLGIQSFSRPHTSVIYHRPQFFKSVQECPDSMKNDLHGPVWITWNKGDTLPLRFRELTTILQ